jgi:hypothetical protein
MAPRLRRMKPYHPRRKRSKGLGVQKQALHDLKHKISSDVGSLLVLIKEGNAAQIAAAQQKTKVDYLKHAEEMQVIAQKMGGRYAQAVRDYLDSVDNIVHTQASWIDDAKIRHCHTMTEKLEKELSVA